MKNTTDPSSDRSTPAANARASLRTVVLSAALLAAAIGLAGAQPTPLAPPTEGVSACATQGGWIDVKTGRPVDRDTLFRDLAANTPVVLLGESHTNADHHHWQLHTLAA